MDFLNGVELHSSLVLLIPALMVIGNALKNTPNFPDWAIVWALLTLGLIAGGAVLGFDFEGIANGVIAAGLAVASHQAFKQTKDRP